MIARAPILKEGMTGNATTLEGTGPFHPTFGPTLPRSINSWRLSSAPHPGVFTSSLNAELPQTAAGTTGSFLSTSLDQETWATLLGMHCVACRTLNSPATPKTWNWDDYVSAHVTEHNIIKGLIAHGYAGIDNIIKVSYLCNRIKSFALAPVHAMTLADGLLGHDFTQCVTLFADYIHHDKLSSTREVATMGTDDGNHDTLRIKQRKQGRERGFRGKPGGKPLPQTHLEACTTKEQYFRTKEYTKLTHVERYKIWKLYKKRSGRGGSGDNGKSQLEELSSQIAELKKQLTKQTLTTRRTSSAMAARMRRRPTRTTKHLFHISARILTHQRES